jgi:hypothetical protein
MTGSDARSEPGGTVGRIRAIPSRIRRLAGLEDRLADVERRITVIEDQMRTPEVDGRALAAVRDAVRDLSIQVTEELDGLSAARTGTDDGAAQG